MAVSDAMFLFEVVVESVKTFVDSRLVVIRTDFADIFSLELKDPKQMHIVIPDPLPLPPEPVGKKKKKAKPKKPKKGKKGKEPPPPPEPVIQAGQSILFASSADVLLQTMLKNPLEISLWSKEDNLTFIGSNAIPWDPVFEKYLEEILHCKEPLPPTVNDEYNIFLEDTAKLMAKIGLQVKLSYLGDKVMTSFRTLSEDNSIKKCLYTGINSKVTSYMCTLKTTEEDYLAYDTRNANYVKDIKKKDPVFADYKNAPGANLSLFNEGDYCCMGNADKPPDSIYKGAIAPDIDHICDYIRKVVVSCNDNMRMLTPQPLIRPIARATDIDRLCYCRETQWPAGDLAQRFKKEVQGGPCPVCSEKKVEGSLATTFNFANIRGPCGRPDCKIARQMTAYIEKLVEEDQTEIDINQIIGPCGSHLCNLAVKIKELLRHEGVFNESYSLDGLQTQCACLQQMQEALTKRDNCASDCSKDCEYESSDGECKGPGCPFTTPKAGPSTPQVYDVYYFTVEHDIDNKSTTDTGTSKAASHGSTQNTSSSKSRASTPARDTDESDTSTSRTDPIKKLKVKKGVTHCSKDCPSVRAIERLPCSGSTCTPVKIQKKKDYSELCPKTTCPEKGAYTPSPADSNIVIDFDDIHNPCCVKTCDVTETVKDFIVDGLERKKKRDKEDPDSCFCDCECTFKFSKKTTYCGICGGYECLGDDMKMQPDHAKPHPCPIYHKLYDRQLIQTPNPWPNAAPETFSVKGSKSSKIAPVSSSDRRMNAANSTSINRSTKKLEDRKSISNKERESSIKKVNEKKKNKVRKPVKSSKAVVEGEATAIVVKKPDSKYPYPAVPKYMGWNWTAEDIPGMKPRPKWKPGAANKILVRRYRALREGADTIAKKKRALLQRKKKIEMKPTLVVTKRDGDYTVQMEVFKKYSKERLLFQYPYDEKPPLIYTIGKTPEEKKKIQKQRDRRERRETRRKNRLLQSTFRDKCQEICVKAYNQAIGVLPLPNPNDPTCPCHTRAVLPESPIIDSCSCSEAGTISSSDTDGDDWVIEFTPPMARWDTKVKHPPVLAENESQYNYLDYKVKLLDRQGNPVARFFKGPDGKEECSDLGGFWNPNHQWMEINKDGYIGPDGRWIPMNFTGPDGMYYSAEEGSFTDATGTLLKLGIDGYIDKDGKWAWYSKSQRGGKPADSAHDKAKNRWTPRQTTAPTPVAGDKQRPHEKPKQGILSKAEKSSSGAAKSVSDKTGPKKTLTYGAKSVKKDVVMSASTTFPRNGLDRSFDRPLKPSLRTRAADSRRIARCQEIMRGLRKYSDLGELRPPIKSNRASNTLRKRVSPFTIYGGFGEMPYAANTVCSTISHSQSGSCLDRSKQETCYY